jgi:hypothetical protein
MSCKQFNPVQSTTTDQQKSQWVQSFWQQVFEDQSGCLSQCELPCIIPFDDDCKACISNLKEIYSSDDTVTNVSSSIKAQCEYQHECIDELLKLNSNPTFDDVSPLVLPGSMSIGEILLIIFGSIIGVLLIALIIFYSIKSRA